MATVIWLLKTKFICIVFNQLKACNCIQVSKLKLFDGLWVINSAEFIVTVIYMYSTKTSRPIYLFKSTYIETNHIEDL